MPTGPNVVKRRLLVCQAQCLHLHMNLTDYRLRKLNCKAIMYFDLYISMLTDWTIGKHWVSWWSWL